MDARQSIGEKARKGAEAAAKQRSAAEARMSETKRPASVSRSYTGPKQSK